MRTPALPQQAKDILNSLTRLSPSLRSVWLFGSRANERIKPDSDTDLLAFANTEFVKKLQAAMPTKPQEVDVLVVVDEDTIIYPWRAETGSLRKWEWKFTSTSSASYVGTKCIPDEDVDEYDLEAYRKISEANGVDEASVNPCQIKILHEQAVRIFPVDA